MFSFFRSRKRAEPATPAAPETAPGSAATAPLSAPPAPPSPAAQPALTPEAVAAAVAVAPTATEAAVPAERAGDSANSDGKGWLGRLRQGLAKTRERLGAGLGGLFQPGSKVDEAWFEQLEDSLLMADVGVQATRRLLQGLREAARRERIADAGALRERLERQLTELLQPLERAIDLQEAPPTVILFVGVNGAGKTTSIGKLAQHLLNQGESVVLAAGDTFRAAAVEQLRSWGERNGVPVISQAQGDSAAVIFDGIQSALARGTGVLLADTAGRLPTQLHLMEELRKVKRVAGKALATAPHEILLVLDANTGQNALAQVKAFDDALGLTGLIVTKLDGTAKGGVLAAIAAERPIPVCFIGVGEKLDDLRPFRAADYAEALLG
ncbi:MAG: signal recognition particle-docking protein FtsY [Pseudomonadota bacterium]|nr:signal recognition particle-docking protein FtsY [Pseudomonadota bacterium]